MQINLFNQSGVGASLDVPDGEVFYYADWLSSRAADKLLSLCSTEMAWQQPEIKVAGKLHRIPRQQVWVGDADAIYRYSQSTFTPFPWPAFLSDLKSKIETECKSHFNSVLLNRYRNGADGMGFHADDEPELGREPVIASLTLGFPRRFVLKHKRGQYPNRELTLQHGDLLMMRGKTQHNWLHGVPKTQKTCGERVNLTFRRIHPGA